MGARHTFGTFGTLCVAFLVASSVAAADAGISDEARQHFKAGVAYLQDPEGERFEDAYREFKKAYELSHSPKVLGNLGLCAMKLERDGEAIDAYTRYLAEVTDIEPAERDQMKRDLQTLSAGVVTVAVAVEGGATSIVDTRVPVVGPSISNYYDLGQGRTVLRIRPGHHLMKPRSASGDIKAWEFTAEASAKLEHTFVATRSPPETSVSSERSPSRVAPIIVTGVGVAALAVGGVLGVATLSRVHNLETECPANACPSAASHDLDVTHNYVRATDFTLLGGGIVFAAGATWFLLSGSHKAESGASNQTAAGGACFGRGCYASLRIGF
jgi:hypothetical protein